VVEKQIIMKNFNKQVEYLSIVERPV